MVLDVLFKNENENSLGFEIVDFLFIFVVNFIIFVEGFYKFEFSDKLGN